MVLAAILALLPPKLTDLVRQPVTISLAPAQRGLAAVGQMGNQASARIRAQFANWNETARSQVDHQRLADENRQLKAALETAGDQVRLLAHRNSQAPPLLSTKCIPARVLGTTAQTYLARYHLLDAGRSRGVEAGAPVLRTATPLIDSGQQDGVENGNVVLAGTCVWGKITSTDSYTSTVCLVTEPGYHDLVRLATTSADGTTLRFGAKGILEGTGEPLARLRMIATTEPVATGDQVYSMAGQGFTEVPLLCGRVVRVERPQGAGHWEIWVAPATDDSPDDLAILCPTTQVIQVARRPAESQAVPSSE